MEAQKIHLILNYYPAILMVIGLLVLTAGIWRKSDRAMRVSMKIALAAALVALPAFVTGEMAGGAAARTYDSPHAQALGIHKGTARTAFVLIEVVGIIALVGSIIFRRTGNLARWFVAMFFIVSLATCALIGYTTYLGRQVKWAGVTANFEIHKENQRWHA